jgi:hypothetical protein
MSFARVRRPNTNTLAKIDAAYLAGLIDGEGSIVAAMKRKGRTTWRLTVSNTNFTILGWCKSVTGVGTVVTKPWDGNKKHAVGGHWQCYSWNAKAVLEQVLPYMRIKQDRALAVIKELGSIQDQNRRLV